MDILVALDSLKGSISSKHANEVVKEGLLLADPDFRVHTVPIADGGEGTVEALVEGTNGVYKQVEVKGPLGEKVTAQYGIIEDGKTAVIEIAEACGLPLVPKQKRNPLYTTSYGVGEIILDAAKNGCNEFIIGLGGSATVDAGIGMLQALGFRFYNEREIEIAQGGQSLSKIIRIDDRNVSEIVKEGTFYVACDVNNPLFGEHGAAYIFGPQKGADEKTVERLDAGLRHFSKIVLDQLHLDLQSIPGAGAAGGLGAAFAGFLQAKLVPGVDLILDRIQMKKMISGVDFVITGEGKLDNQTAFGKAPAGIAKLAKQFDIPVVAIAGDVQKADMRLHDHGIDAYFSIVPGPMDLDEAMEPITTKENLKRTGEQIGRMIRILHGSRGQQGDRNLDPGVGHMDRGDRNLDPW